MIGSEMANMVNDSFTRRGLLVGSLAFLAGGCASVPRQALAPEPLAQPEEQFQVDPTYRRQRVPYDGGKKPGTIVVNRGEHFLYFVEEGGWATRYGVGVGREGLTLTGRATVGRKEEWPSWTPTANMMRREPRFLQYAGGVPGGPQNPLGARALYLYRGGRDTMFRLHGTNEPWSIGQSLSNGCIRLMNEDIIHLYERTPARATVIVI